MRISEGKGWTRLFSGGGRNHGRLERVPSDQKRILRESLASISALLNMLNMLKHLEGKQAVA